MKDTHEEFEDTKGEFKGRTPKKDRKQEFEYTNRRNQGPPTEEG
jgi:hypothetical protein